MREFPRTELRGVAAMKQKIKRALRLIKFAIVRWGIKWNDGRFSKDLARWKQVYKISEPDKTAAAMLAWDFPEFRNLIVYRHPKGLWKYWFKFWYSPMDTLFINTSDIGGGLFIQHGFATIISAQSLGENCWVNQQVTIGHTGGGRPPVIGNNVMITSGAKVLGSITVGDGAVIGANAVVIRDVEPGAVMGGVPARRLK